MGFFCVWSLFCYAVLNVLSSFEIVLLRKREPIGLHKLSCRCLVALPHGAVGWSAVHRCDCGISWPHSFTYLLTENTIMMLIN